MMPQTDVPGISVIIPVYNQELYLEQCLDSVLNQTFVDMEVLCIDDGSSDRSPEILENYAKKDDRLRIFHQKNQGAGAARNHGLRMAKGTYLSFLDSDDFFEPDMLLKAYEQAKRDQADFVVFESDQYQTDQDKFVPCSWAVRKADLPPYTPFTYRQLTDNIFESFVGWAWDKLYLHSFIKEKQLWFQEQRTSNDLLFVFSALVAARRISVVREVLAHQRRGNKNSLSNTREKSWFCFYDALIALREYLKQQGIFWEVERDFVNYALNFLLWHLNTLEEPAKGLLKKELCEKYFEELSISERNSGYFYNRQEFKEYQRLVR